MKKVLSLLSLASGIFLAQTQASAHGSFIGGSAGYGFNNAKVAQKRGSAVDNSSTVASDRGFLGGLHLGHDWSLGKSFILGMEAQWLLVNSHVTNKIDTQNIRIVELRQRDAWNASVRAGGIFSNVLFYAKAGFSLGRFTGKGTINAVETTVSKRSQGYLLGAGIEVPVSKSFIAGLEGVYTRYQGFRVINNDVLNAEHTIKPESGSVLLRLSYRF